VCSRAAADEDVSLETKGGARFLVALLLDTSLLFAQWSPRAGKLLAAMKETSHA
jgi:hypothetical protein